MIRVLSYLASLAAGATMVALLVIGGLFMYYGRNLPDPAELADYEPDVQSRVYASDGASLAEFVRERRIFTRYDDIPPFLIQAFISAEDKNYFQHRGVDPLGMARAMVRNVSRVMQGRRASGASTITQQVVKNRLLTNTRSIERKVREMTLAMRVEELLTKEQIIEIYLNDIFLGSNAYGVGAAALNYFGKSLHELTVAEAAYLAALPKAPSQLHPIRNHDYAVARRNYVLGEMLDNGYIDQAAHDEARAAPLKTVLQNRTAQRGAYDWSAAYAIESARAQALDMFGEHGVYGGGMTLNVTLDMEMQRNAAQALAEGLHRYDRRHGWRGPAARLDGVEGWREALADLDLPRDVAGWSLAAVLMVGDDTATLGIEGADGSQPLLLNHVAWARRPNANGNLGREPRTMSDVLAPGDVVYVTEKPEGWGLRQIPDVNGAVVAMDPYTGRVLAMQGGISAQVSDFNRVSQAERQPGSTIKPLVYAAALDNGYTPATQVLDGPFTNQEEAPGWRPENYSGEFYGWEPLRRGLERSYNMMTLRLAYDVGLETIEDYAERMGIYDDAAPHWSLAIGSGETTLLRLTTAFSMFVNGGRQITPAIIDRARNRYGETVYRSDERRCEGCELSLDEALSADAPPAPPEIEDAGVQVIDPVTAYQVTSLMQGVATRGTARGLANMGYDVGGKSGTTNEAKDAWFIGFTSEIVVGCFIGYDDPRSLGRRASGGALCGPVFRDILEATYKDRQPGPIVPPEIVEFARVDRFTGTRVPDDAEPPEPGRYIQEAFRKGTAPELTAGWAQTNPFVGQDDGGLNGGAPPPGGDLNAAAAAQGCGTPGTVYGDQYSGDLFSGRFRLEDGCLVQLLDGNIIEIIENPNAPAVASAGMFNLAGAGASSGSQQRRLTPPSGNLVFDNLGRLADPDTGYLWESETGLYLDPASGALVDDSGLVVGGNTQIAATSAIAPQGGPGEGASLGDSFDGGGLY